MRRLAAVVLACVAAMGTLCTGGVAVSGGRVVGAGGAIKLQYEAALEQRMRLDMEGVRFRGKRIDMAEHQHRFRTWEFD